MTEKSHVVLEDIDHLREVLVSIRSYQGWSQRDIAHALQKRQSEVCEWEIGMTRVSLETLMTWANALGYRLSLTRFADPLEDYDFDREEHGYGQAVANDTDR